MDRAGKLRRLAAAGFLLAAGCGDDSITVFCNESTTPFELAPLRVEVLVGEEATFSRVTRESGRCGLLPDSDAIVWSLNREGIVTIIASDDRGATVRADSEGSVRIRAELVALDAGSSADVIVVNPE